MNKRRGSYYQKKIKKEEVLIGYNVYFNSIMLFRHTQ